VGWASASEIFDPVARALIDLGADAPTKRKVLGTLLRKLRDEDWDTADESLAEFHDDPVIVQIFYEQGVGNSAGNWPEGVIGHDKRTNEWTLTCQGGRDSCGELARGDGDSPKEHDRLVHAWVAHDRQKHGGDGRVPDWMLIERGADR
jgi:hypothetical protein